MRKNILFVARTMELGGTEKVILQLCDICANCFNKIVVCSSGGLNVKKLEKQNIEHVLIPDISSKNIFKLIKAKITIIKTIKKYDIKVVHTHHRMAAFLCRNLKNVRLINNVHNTFLDKKLLTKIALSNYINIAVGNTVYNNLTCYYGIPQSKVKLITNSIDTHYEYQEIPSLFNKTDEKSVKFVFVGRLENQKGVDILIHSFEKYLFDRNVILFIYGDGNLKEYVKKHCGEKIHYMGYTDNPLNVISQCDCMILPSRWEGLPLIIIESFSVSTPVICSNIGPNIELVDDGWNGLVFENECAESLAQKIIEFIECRDIEYFKNNALITYERKYKYSIFKEKYERLYNDE